MRKIKEKTVLCQNLGIPLKESIAKQVDHLVKTLPKELRYKRQGVVAESSELIKGERASIALVSVETTDREGEVVLSKGLNTELFVRNPIVCWAHKYDIPPVGKCDWIKKISRAWKAKTTYSDSSELSRTVWKLTQEGILKGFSIGFLPTKIRSPTQSELAQWKNCERVIESGVLLEYSVAPIPVCQDALVEAVAKGRADTKTLNQLGFTIPKPKFNAQLVSKWIGQEFNRLSKEITADPNWLLNLQLEKYRA